MSEPDATVEAVYKEHSARLLAVLVRIFGTRNLELAEDVLQEAFRRAIVAWAEKGVPAHPAGWIMTAAKNHAIDVIRAQRTQRRFSEDLASHLQSDWTLPYAVEREFSDTRIQDDQLRMIFMCTGADLTPENRLPLILRSLCGFSIPAVARALLLPEGTVKKRLLRTRERLEGRSFDFPPVEELPRSMEGVHTVLYLLFNEGFHSSEEGKAMNLELCREAVHLTNLLVGEPRIVNRETLGLLALMNFHLARAEARVDADGFNVPLDLQDRSRWDPAGIEVGNGLLRLASALPHGASGRFQIEARIAAEHCKAGSFQQTDWPAIVRLYDELVEVTGSPVARLNQAVAIGYAGDAEGAIERALALRDHPVLRGSHLPAALLAHLHARRGDEALARRYADESTRLGGTTHEQRMMHMQVERLLARADAGALEFSEPARA
jgi:RNA polymerase sigma-70 factor (ECF subfamily)